MSNIRTAFRKLHMTVWSNCDFNFISLRALRAQEHRTQLLSTCLIFLIIKLFLQSVVQEWRIFTLVL